MGAVGRTQTCGPLNADPPPSLLLPSCSPPSRLASLIFFCSHSTYHECIQKRLFGLPQSHFDFVRNIRPGMPLFLFNYSDRKLHGIFEADSRGELNINRYAWCHQKTPYRAQVRVRVRQPCSPLPEKVFKNAITDNYYKESHFYFELNHAQTNALISLFTKEVQTSDPIGRPTVNRAYEDDWKHPKNPTRHIMAEHCNAPPFKPPAIENSGLSKGKNAIPELNEGRNTTLKFSGSSCENVLNGKLESENWERKGANDKQKPQVKHEVLEKLEQSQVRNLQDISEIKREAPVTQKSAKSKSSTSVGTRLDCKYVDSDILEWEKMARERCLQELTTFGGDHERLNESFQSLDVPVDRAISKSLEVCSSAIAQMRQKEIGLRHVMDQAYSFTRIAMELDELMKVNAELENTQAQMASELESLKLEVRWISEKQMQTTGIQGYELDADTEETREIRGSVEQLYILGGHNGQSWLGTVDVLCPNTQQCFSVASMLSPRSYAASCALMGKIYVFGGGDGRLWYETVEMYDTTTDVWINCAPMRHKRGCLAVATIGDRIFAVGGGHAQVLFSDVECYDPQLGTWTRSTSMLTKRFGVAATELDGALYAIGGYDGRVYLVSVERLDPREAHWTAISPMNRKRGILSAASLGGKIYAIGGYDGSECLSSVEVYEPRTNSWVEMESKMHQGRVCGAAGRVGDRIYMVDGRNVGVQNGPYVDKVECYRENMGWEVRDDLLSGGRCFHSCAALHE